MDKYNDIKKQYNKTGKRYIELADKYIKEHGDVVAQEIQDVLPDLSGKKALDIGCGHGRLIKLIELLSDSVSVYGIDISEVMINEAKKRVAEPSNFFVADIEARLPFEDNFFNIIIGKYVFHYLKGFEKAYLELGRIIRPNGYMILTVQHPIMDFILQKDKIYGKQEIVTTKRLGGEFKLKYPSHKIEDYFSDTFFKIFYLDYFKEIQYIETNNALVPNGMLIKAVKRGL